LSLASPALQVWVDGRVTPAQERLDLEAVVHTGGSNLLNQRTLRLLGVRLAVAGVSPPVALLLEARDFLSNRTIDLTITGTVQSPVVQIRPLRFLTEEAVRFFINSLIPVQ
jgi:hypothetical protein